MKTELSDFIKSLGIFSPRAYWKDSDGWEGWPCNVTRILLTDHFDTPKKFDKYIDLAIDSCRRGMLIFSFHEQEKHHKMWLKRIEQWTERTVTITRSNSRGHGLRKVWLVCIPLYDVESEEYNKKEDEKKKKVDLNERVVL